MNKLKLTIAGLLIACLGIGINAQDNTTAPAKPAPKKTAAKSTTAKPATKPAIAPATNQHMKKDGTPDKRYKENKGTTTPAKATENKTPSKKESPKKAATGDNKTM